jgi:hypothetical protein
MYEYQYIEIHTGGGFWIDNGSGGHREVIDREARDGWRYVGYVPLTFSSRGGIKSMDLVFEREIKE